MYIYMRSTTAITNVLFDLEMVKSDVNVLLSSLSLALSPTLCVSVIANVCCQIVRVMNIYASV